MPEGSSAPESEVAKLPEDEATLDQAQLISSRRVVRILNWPKWIQQRFHMGPARTVPPFTEEDKAEFKKALQNEGVVPPDSNQPEQTPQPPISPTNPAAPKAK